MNIIFYTKLCHSDIMLYHLNVCVCKSVTLEEVSFVADLTSGVLKISFSYLWCVISMK